MSSSSQEVMFDEAAETAPPSSSPIAGTPPEVIGQRFGSTTACWGDCSDDKAASQDRTFSRGCSGSSFVQSLDRLLLAAIQEPGVSYAGAGSSSSSHTLDRSAADRTTLFSFWSRTCTEPIGPPGSGSTTLDNNIGNPLATTGAYTQSSVPQKRLQPGPFRSRAGDNDLDDNSGSLATNKKQKLCGDRSRQPGKDYPRKRTTQPPIAGLSGAFKLRYAKGPGSLRRAESLRSKLSSTPAQEEVVLNEVTERSPVPVSDYSELAKAFCPKNFPIIVGSTASPLGGYAPTVPTTPTSNDPSSCRGALSPTLADLPIITPPSFQLIPRAPLSQEEAAERRIVALLEREWEQRAADGLIPAAQHPVKSIEDEEERFWAEPSVSASDEYETETEEIYNVLRTPDIESPRPINRALISRSLTELNIDSRMLGEVMEWFLEVMPPEEDHDTSYAPGDLYDLLSSSDETHFHAAHIFMRYFHVVGAPDKGEEDDDEALEAVTWDLAVACLALSVKFHRDVLFPLDVIYAQEFLDLAPHRMEFANLENAQRDVLEALAFRVGSVTPGAFMAELWEALPTLRILVGFDGGWDGVQDKAWDVLCDALQQQDLLRFPISLLTAATVTQGVLEVLVKRYKATGMNGRGKSLSKRDTASLRKAAKKCSRGVRLDIQEVLQISDQELLACHEWLGLAEWR